MTMPPRLRKFIGAIALLVLVIVWSLVGMALAQSILLSTNGFYALIYYVVVGLGWVLPAMPIIWWMAQGDRQKNDAARNDSGKSRGATT